MKYVVILLIGLVMFFSNPSKTEFTSFLASHIRTEMQKQAETEELSNFSGGIASLFAKNNLERTNYIIASTYFIDMSTFRDFGAEVEDIHMLGIFKTFVPLP